MPFTLSHAAVAAPLARRGLVLSAVVIGSMAPDFEYFLRLSMNSRWGHTAPGLIAFTLPVSLLALWLFHALLKRPLLALMPPAHRDRLATVAGPFRFGPGRRFFHILVSLHLGIGSHLLLDAWSHREGTVVQQWPWLQAALLDWPAYSLPVYDLIQAGLSSLLLVALGVQYWHWFRHALPEPATLADFVDVRPVLLPLAVIGTIAVACGLVYAGYSAPPVRDALSFRVFGGRAILAGLAAFAAGLMLLGWIRERSRLVAVREDTVP